MILSVKCLLYFINIPNDVFLNGSLFFKINHNTWKKIAVIYYFSTLCFTWQTLALGIDLSGFVLKICTCSSTLGRLFGHNYSVILSICPYFSADPLLPFLVVWIKFKKNLYLLTSLWWILKPWSCHDIMLSKPE